MKRLMALWAAFMIAQSRACGEPSCVGTLNSGEKAPLLVLSFFSPKNPTIPQRKQIENDLNILQEKIGWERKPYWEVWTLSLVEKI